MVDFTGIFLLVGILLLGSLLAIRCQRTSWAYRLGLAVFGLYLLLVAAVIISPPTPILNYGGQRDSVAEILARINLRPFDFGNLFLLSSTVILHQLIGNVLLTLPFGFGLPWLIRLRGRSIIWLGPAVGLALEGAQLVENLFLGASLRGVDINDVLLNALGVWIGYGLFRGFAWVYVALLGQLAVQPRGLPAFLYALAGQARGSIRRRSQEKAESSIIRKRR
jgi:glycopeptide antibiotics resistance protein